MLTKAGAARAYNKRKNYKAKPIVLDPNFPDQNSLILDPARYLAVQCSRRAGKTTGLAIKFFNTLEKYPGSQCIYLSLTYDSARDIMWPVLQELNDKYKIGCTFIESKLWMLHPNGSKLKLVGADMKNFIKRLKGRKFPGVGVDESQDFGSHLQSLVDDILTPSIADYEDGWIALTGTPGPVPQGYFFDITNNKKFGYSNHSWTLFENPHMPNPRAFVADLKKRREWEDNHPTLLREWRNQWVLDVQSLWIRYNESINHYTELPTLPAGKLWNYILGIDIGYRDADALAVLAWSEHDPNTYLVKEVITTKQDITSLAEQIAALAIEYPISKMIMDEGALGKKAAEELRRRKHLPIQPADKTRKQENVEILNDCLRRGRLKAKSASRFAQDSYLVQIDWDKSTPERIIIKKNPHSDIIDSVLYAFKESPAFTYVATVDKPKYGTKEWAEAQQSQMFEAAQTHFQELADRDKGWHP